MIQLFKNDSLIDWWNGTIVNPYNSRALESLIKRHWQEATQEALQEATQEARRQPVEAAAPPYSSRRFYLR